MARILLIDDDRFVSQMLARMLRADGHLVTVENDPNQGLRIAWQFHDELDLLILDVQMPELDGIGLLTALNEAPHHPPPTILISAYAESDGADAMLTRARPLGAVAAIAKPITQQRLTALVADVLSKGGLQDG